MKIRSRGTTTVVFIREPDEDGDPTYFVELNDTYDTPEDAILQANRGDFTAVAVVDGRVLWRKS